MSMRITKHEVVTVDNFLFRKTSTIPHDLILIYYSTFGLMCTLYLNNIILYNYTYLLSDKSLNQIIETSYNYRTN